MSEQAAIMAGEGGRSASGWAQCVDRFLLERLRRRPTVISSALAQRIRRRADYFMDRARALAQSLIDRASPNERSLQDMPVVHVQWHSAAGSPGDAPTAASFPVQMHAAQTAAVRVVQIEAPAIKAADAVRGETSKAEQAHVNNASPGTVHSPVATAAPGVSHHHLARTTNAAPAESMRQPFVTAHDPRRSETVMSPSYPAIMPGDDEAMTLHMPPRRPMRESRAMAALPEVSGEAGQSSRLGQQANHASPRRVESATTSTNQPPLRSASAAVTPDAGNEMGIELLRSSGPRKERHDSPPVRAAVAVKHAPGLDMPIVHTDVGAGRAAPAAEAGARTHVKSSSVAHEQNGSGEAHAVLRHPSTGAAVQRDITALSILPSHIELANPIRARISADVPSSSSDLPVQSARAVHDHATPPFVPMALLPVRSPPLHADSFLRWTPSSESPNAFVHERAGRAWSSAVADMPQPTLPHAASSAASPTAEAWPFAQRSGVDATNAVGRPAAASSDAQVLSSKFIAQPAPMPSPQDLRALIDVAELASRVERRIMQRLAIDTERQGGWS